MPRESAMAGSQRESAIQELIVEFWDAKGIDLLLLTTKIRPLLLAALQGMEASRLHSDLREKVSEYREIDDIPRDLWQEWLDACDAIKTADDAYRAQRQKYTGGE